MSNNISFSNIQVYGFESALRGMRNPKNSWDRSDSCEFGLGEEGDKKNRNVEWFKLGDKDKELAQRLSKAGAEHRKYLRMITVWIDITAPRFFWTEFDTYKHVVSNSQSTMHKITSRLLCDDDFVSDVPITTINNINSLIHSYNHTRYAIDKEALFRKIKSNLPEGFLQTRTVCLNYETLLNQYNQRKNHRLSEWLNYCEWIKLLPYFTELTGVED